MTQSTEPLCKQKGMRGGEASPLAVAALAEETPRACVIADHLPNTTTTRQHTTTSTASEGRFTHACDAGLGLIGRAPKLENSCLAFSSSHVPRSHTPHRRCPQRPPGTPRPPTNYLRCWATSWPRYEAARLKETRLLNPHRDAAPHGSSPLPKKRTRQEQQQGHPPRPGPDARPPAARQNEEEELEGARQPLHRQLLPLMLLLLGEEEQQQQRLLPPLPRKTTRRIACEGHTWLPCWWWSLAF